MFYKKIHEHIKKNIKEKEKKKIKTIIGDNGLLWKERKRKRRKEKKKKNGNVASGK